MTVMKLKEGFVLREVANSVVVLPTGGDLDMNMMITLNGTGRFLWEKLEKGAEEEELVRAMLAEYAVDEATARAHIKAFCAKLEEKGFFE